MSRFLSRCFKFLPILALTGVKKTLFYNDDYSGQQIQTSIQRLYLSALDFQLSQFKVFELDTGQLGMQVAAHLDIAMGRISSQKFNDGQCNIQIQDSVRGHNVYLIKGFGQKRINDGIIELIIAINTLKKEGASKVTCIIPYFPYSQSLDSQVEQQRVFFTCFGADILRLLQDSGCDSVITFNSLMSYPKGFVNQCTFMNINAPDLFIGHLATKQLKDPILVSSQINTPNVNNLHILKKSLKMLNFHCPISAFNDNQYIGEPVRDRDVILYTNIVRTGKTLRNLSQKLKHMGARNVYGCAFHCLGTQQQTKSLMRDSYLSQLLTTNSSPHSKFSKNIKTTSLSRLIAQIIVQFQKQKSLNEYRMELQDKKMEVINKIKQQNRGNTVKINPKEVL